VRALLANLDGAALLPQAGNQEEVLAEWTQRAERLHTRLRQLDKRLEEQLSAAAKGRITREQLHKLSITTAGERLRTEEEEEEVERRIQDQTDASERTRGRQKALAILLDGWDEQPVEEKQQHLREMLDRVVVRDEGIQLVLRP
jgi:hypothetical protein